ncbi:protein kinase family protein [Striga asiatica]|uniref:Protein kinase family protein n=1 Tax=Striga asiatica TaxID=4170 RepID=A0A5A7RH85_STRAF|nr:protein kinase family protein [Striga asiatica]
MNLLNWAPAVVGLVFLEFLSSSSSLAQFTPTDNHLIACGSQQNVTFTGQTYIPDSSQSSFSLKSSGNSITATSNSTAPFPIYQSARIFTSTASYKFNIRQQGRHWVRLYFYPIPGRNLTSASISVVTEDFVLLHNFSFATYNGTYFSKEYAVNVTSNSLSVNFIPGNNSLAFINAIEVVSLPDDLIPDQADGFGPYTRISGISGLALETVYRLNMGGPLLTPQNDTLGRTWENDVKYLHVNSSAVNVSVDPSNIKYGQSVTPQIAPNYVYATAQNMGDANVIDVNFNITWVLKVDPGFSYLVRFHFCDIVSKSLNRLVFNVYANAELAIGGLDLSNQAGDLDAPYYRDFVVELPSNSSVLTVSVGPDTNTDFINAILNGLEVMKMSNEARSLTGSLPVDTLLVLPHKKNNKSLVVVGSAAGAAAAAGAVVFIGLCLVCLRARGPKAGRPSVPLHGNSLTVTKTSGTASCVSMGTPSLGRCFTFQEIMDATNNFDEGLLLGVGGFGRVYRGTLEDGCTRVAVKRGNPRSEQGLAEFRTEIEMLSKLRHRHLVSLIGYCDERSEMILVYEYMANGPLRSHLYGSGLPPLLWRQRLEICIGAARGLHYLHTGATRSVIHRDVKTTNILLDEGFTAKVADFGLSKAGPDLDQTHVSTAVKGSFGYLDPEYFRRQQLTEKSDVYSFGVVMVEVLCARPALNPVLPREQVNIAEWAMTWQRKGMLEHVMDKSLVGKVNLASLKKFGETAEKCLAEHGVDRPSMGDVLWNLEYALQLEETTSALMEPEDNSTNHIPLGRFDNSVSMIEGGHSISGTDDDGEDVATSAVFSQLVNPRGR